jgi:hypothetical protein
MQCVSIISGRIFHMIRILIECDIGEELYKELHLFDFRLCRAIVLHTFVDLEISLMQGSSL